MDSKRPRNVHTAEYRLFAGCLRRARREAGLTQWIAADRIGRPQSYIAKCESGERRVDVVELKQLAKIYKKKVSYFIPN